MKFALRTGAVIGSLALTLFLAGTMSSDAPSPRPARAVAGPAAATRGPAADVDEAATDPGAARCDGWTGRVVLVPIPFRPRAGERVRLLAVSRERLGGFVARVEDEAVRAIVPPVDEWGPGPYAWEFAVGGLPAGTYRVTLHGSGADELLGCARLDVAAAGARERSAATSGVWPVRREWSGALEDLYSVWVARLFRAPEGPRRGWPRLHTVFRDADRNVLFDALGWGEDGGLAGEGLRSAVRARADCGDLPYTLRAYFAWKFELPFRFQRCNRRNPLVGAECYEERSNLTDRFAEVADPVQRFNRFLETDIANGVHSATPRTLPEDDASDFYPVRMTRAALRPGTVYVWPYGHLLVIAGWVSDEAGGLRLVAVDGHPDGTVTYKSFSPRNFPYLPGLRTAGFKAFRPVVFDDGAVRPVDNAGLAAVDSPQPFSEEQYRFRQSRDFYRAVGQVSALFPLEPAGG